jgi:glyoxylase-like metal-dependent hydrolase (beta-lactamase superfamily II)
MVYEKITDGVYAITDGSTRGNVAAFELPNQIVVIDGGMNNDLVRQFREELEKKTGKKTTTMFLTHEHLDHVLGTGVFEDCTVVASNETAKHMQKSLETNWTPEKIEEYKKTAEDPKIFDNFKVVLPQQTFKETYELVDDEIKVIIKKTGGHTDGSSHIYCPQYKALFAGDNLFVNLFPWGGTDTANPDQWIEALEEYLALDIDYYIPGHGPIDDGTYIKEFLDYLRETKKVMKQLIAEGKSKEEVVQAADAIEYYPPRREQWKKLTLERWYEVWAK